MINTKKYNWKELHNSMESDIMDLIKKHKTYFSKSIIKDRFNNIIHKNQNAIVRDLIGNV